MELVPVRLLDVDEDTAAKLALADNKIGERSTWDYDALADLAQDFDLSELGWAAAEVEMIVSTESSLGFGAMGDTGKPRRESTVTALDRPTVQGAVGCQRGGAAEHLAERVR